MTFNYRSRVFGAVFVAGVEISKNIIKIREKQLCLSIHFYVDPRPTFTPSTKSIFARDCVRRINILNALS